MFFVNDKSSLRDTIQSLKLEGKSIGLVPTMGALHEGHLELIRLAKADCQIVICSIYVNPTQFNNSTDLEKYPRNQEKDLLLLKKVGCDIAFCPTDELMYGDLSTIKFDFGNLGEVLEGQYRPGHFSGVGLAVSKLFNLVMPTKAYFGQKDLQQFAIIKRLVNELHFNIDLVCAPIIRDNNGLALSSRNLRLSNIGEEKALLFSKTLNEIRDGFHDGKPLKDLINDARTNFISEEIELEYLEVINKDTFESLPLTNDLQNAAICIAGYVESVRLIDNMLLN